MSKPFVNYRKPTLRERIQHKLTWWHWRYLVWSGYYAEDGEPLRCRKCDSWHYSNHKEYTVDSINGIACEVEIRCLHCDNPIGYWAYGSYQPLHF